jgi:hypothetical protein
MSAQEVVSMVILVIDANAWLAFMETLMSLMVAEVLPILESRKVHKHFIGLTHLYSAFIDFSHQTNMWMQMSMSVKLHQEFVKDCAIIL